ncbi:uncharacterized protein GGS22DRAFT_190611 [Annulohypoxylon maeteangense]|uniref:uncharacterized protein n=1 Tax=Annulohypoxylon maeteangense TaxID=1927788 RepID=UPI002008BF83|nr:uncharacterized protein GGS22DRAFT_190611 [Annulohypoxylon maeteangense]KAI0883296.1 hypothetical protein GGS22DRAFT_190611 [Annulohypoxylon maeteangense]
MIYSLRILLVVATIVSTALANFTIYIAKANEITDAGVTFSSTELQVHKHAPLSCSDMGHVIPISASTINDASKGRWACDGCNANAPRDWIISRFEMYNRKNAIGRSTDHPFPLFNRATGAVTLYGTGNGNYDMRDINNTFLGTCNRPRHPQEMDCWQLISATFLTHVFTCTSDLVPNEGLWI